MKRKFNFLQQYVVPFYYFLLAIHFDSPSPSHFHLRKGHPDISIPTLKDNLFDSKLFLFKILLSFHNIIATQVWVFAAVTMNMIAGDEFRVYE